MPSINFCLFLGGPHCNANSSKDHLQFVSTRGECFFIKCKVWSFSVLKDVQNYDSKTHSQVPTKYMQLHMSQYHREAMMQQVGLNLSIDLSNPWVISCNKKQTLHLSVHQVKQEPFTPPILMMRPAKKYDYSRAPNNQSIKQSPISYSIRPLVRLVLKTFLLQILSFKVENLSASSSLNFAICDHFQLVCFASAPSFGPLPLLRHEVCLLSQSISGF